MTEERRQKVIENARAWKIRTDYKTKRKETKRRRRLQVLNHYSNGEPVCNCCKESTYEFLVLDHKDGGGNKHRKEIWGRVEGGSDTVDWIIKNDYPPLFQVLCQNCNSAKGHYGKCPHEK